MMPADAIETLRAYDAILLGAVGWPGVPDHVSLWGLLIPIRRAFRQYVNLRPVRVFEGVDQPAARRPSPAASTWSWCGRTSRASTARSAAGSTAASPTRWPCRSRSSPAWASSRIARLRVRAGPARGAARLTSATKSNGIVHTLPFWDEVVRRASPPTTRTSSGTPEHIDALAAKVVLDPGRFDVIVGSNLFGDILSDLAAAVAGQHRHRAVGQPRPDPHATRRCSSRCTARRRTSPARASPTRSARSGRRR